MFSLNNAKLLIRHLIRHDLPKGCLRKNLVNHVSRWTSSQLTFTSVSKFVKFLPGVTVFSCIL